MNKKLLLPLMLFFCYGMNGQVLNWIVSMDNAIEISNKERKPMLLWFMDAGSTKGALNSQIFNTLDFAIWARDNVVLVKVDLTDDDSNDFLQRSLSLKNAFGVQELPTICFAKASVRKDKINYELIGKTGFKSGGVKNWIVDAQAILRGPQEE